MQEQDNGRTVDRRRVLRRAGTLAAGVAGAGVAGAVVATPAQAADGSQLVIGQANTGTATTKLTAGGAATPAVRLENTAGSALSVLPTDPTVSAPPGSIFVDRYGDVSAIGNTDGKGATVSPYVTYAYSPTWAMMPWPVRTVRWLDTRYSTKRGNIVAGSASYDSSGRVIPKNSTTVPDMVINLSGFFKGGVGAVQANLTVVYPTGLGWAALWDAGTFPSNSSINYVKGVNVANFTQTLIGPDRYIRFKTSLPVAVILDIVGFVVADPFAQLDAAKAGLSTTR